MSEQIIEVNGQKFRVTFEPIEEPESAQIREDNWREWDAFDGKWFGTSIGTLWRLEGPEPDYKWIAWIGKTADGTYVGSHLLYEYAGLDIALDVTLDAVKKELGK